jgi:hypothetical protein
MGNNRQAMNMMSLSGFCSCDYCDACWIRNGVVRDKGKHRSERRKKSKKEHDGGEGEHDPKVNTGCLYRSYPLLYHHGQQTNQLPC